MNRNTQETNMNEIDIKPTDALRERRAREACPPQVGRRGSAATGKGARKRARTAGRSSAWGERCEIFRFFDFWNGGDPAPVEKDELILYCRGEVAPAIKD